MKEMLFFTLPYFVIGAIGIVFINRKTPDIETKKKLWLKYVVYFFIVHGVFLLLYSNRQYLKIFSIVLLALALFEILNNGIKHSQNKIPVLIALVIFSVIAAGFVLFINIPVIDLAPTYLIVIVFDGYSQIIGQLTGRHRLAPRISPNKTIEGTIGGFLVVLLTLFIYEKGHINTIGLFCAIWICTFALTGDLLASWYKRVLGIKDYSKLIPGHGGVLDRFDSFLTAGAASFIFIQYIEPKLALL